jgi:hypothetical protein
MADDRFDGWESNRKRKLTRGLDATPPQRLAWLEAAIRLAHAAGALPRARQSDGERARDDTAPGAELRGVEASTRRR